MDKKLQENIIKYAIGAGLAYFLVARPILMKLGILKSDKQTSIENETLKIDSAFNPNYWKQFSGPKVITDIALNDIINIIQDSFGVISDNYDAVLAQFKKLSYKTQVSYLADKWQQQKGTDFLSFLGNGGGIFPWDGLSNDHLAALISYVNNLK